MNDVRWLMALLLALVVLPLPASAAPSIAIVDDTVEMQWPSQMVFRLKASSDAPISRVRIDYRYGSNANGGGGNPTFTAGQEIQSEFILKTGGQNYVPAGVAITYSYTVEDSAGNRVVSEPKTVRYLDSRYRWESIAEGPITFFYHDVPDTRPRQLLAAAIRTIGAYREKAGTELKIPIAVFLYNSVREMEPALSPRSASEQGSIAGTSYPGYDVIHTTDSRDLTNAVSTMDHEIAHQITNAAAKNAFVEIPSWLNEGISVYFQQDGGKQYLALLPGAIRQNKLLPLRYLTVYPGKADEKILVYAQGGSIVGYLIDTYGAEQMAALLAATRAGTGQDEALRQVYGKDRDGIDTEWRAFIGAPPDTASTPVAAAPRPTTGPVAVAQAATSVVPWVAGGVGVFVLLLLTGTIVVIVRRRA